MKQYKEPSNMETINKELSLKKFIKKIYDNSYYPATYNIERNCLEYPEMPNVFYFYNKSQYEETLRKSKLMIEIEIKKLNKYL